MISFSNYAAPAGHKWWAIGDEGRSNVTHRLLPSFLTPSLTNGCHEGERSYIFLVVFSNIPRQFHSLLIILNINQKKILLSNKLLLINCELIAYKLCGLRCEWRSLTDEIRLSGGFVLLTLDIKFEWLSFYTKSHLTHVLCSINSSNFFLVNKTSHKHPQTDNMF